jgi:hypothetical protein
MVLSCRVHHAEVVKPSFKEQVIKCTSSTHQRVQAQHCRSALETAAFAAMIQRENIYIHKLVTRKWTKNESNPLSTLRQTHTPQKTEPLPLQRHAHICLSIPYTHQV